MDFVPIQVKKDEQAKLSYPIFKCIIIYLFLNSKNVFSIVEDCFH